MARAKWSRLGRGVVQSVEPVYTGPKSLVRQDTDASSTPRCGKRFFCHSHFLCSFLQCLHSTRVQSHAPTTVHTLKIPNCRTLAAVPSLFGHRKILHTLIGMGSAAKQQQQSGMPDTGGRSTAVSQVVCKPQKDLQQSVRCYLSCRV